MGHPLLKSKSALIVEDQAEMRFQLRGMFEKMGMKEAVSVSSAAKAFEQLEEFDFDLVCLDYDLGSGKNGAQIMAEAKARKLVSSSCIFAFITGLQNASLVMGIVELQPDIMLSKPLNFEELKQRVIKLFEDRNQFQTIDELVDQGQIEDAIKACDVLMKKDSTQKLAILKRKSELMIRCEKFEDAELILREVLKFRGLNWAKKRLIQCLMIKKSYDEAKPILEELTEAYDHYAEGFDQLAVIHEANGNLDLAQQALEQAVASSPNQYKRQSNLSRLSSHNGHWALSAKSSRKAINLCKNTEINEPSLFLNLARALQPNLNTENFKDRTYALNEINQALELVRKDNVLDENAHLDAVMIQSLTHKNIGETEKSIQLTRIAKKIFEVMILSKSLPSKHETRRFIEDIAENLIQGDCLKDAFNFLSMIDKLKLADPAYMANKKTFMEEQAEIKRRAQTDAFNNKGVDLFDRGFLDEAVEVFRKALFDPKASSAVVMNAIQTSLAWVKEKGKHEEVMAELKDYFDRIGDIPEKDRRYARYKHLMKAFNDL